MAQAPAEKPAPPPTPPERKVADLWNEADEPDFDDKELKSLVLEAWKQTVSVQMHFNEICMSLRNIAITMLAGAVGLAAFSAKENIQMTAMGITIPIGAVVALAGLIGWAAFYGMDVHWYHSFLGGAGTHAGRIEERWRKHLPEFMLSSQIREDSAKRAFGMRINSTRRLTIFYLLGAIVLVITATVVWRAHPLAPATPATGTPTPVTTNTQGPAVVAQRTTTTPAPAPSTSAPSAALPVAGTAPAPAQEGSRGATPQK
jgi:hypothetical protein